MRPPGAGKRRDANETEIVRALEGIGALVLRQDKPVDLCVGFRGAWYWLEVKDGDKPPSERRPTADQLEFMALTQDLRLPAAYVSTVEEAMAAIGAT